MWAGGASALPAPRLQSRPSVAPAGVPAMVWHLYRAIFTDLNTNGYCLIVSRFISQTSSAPAPAQLLQSKPLSLNRAAYCLLVKRIDLWPPPLKVRRLRVGGEAGPTGGGRGEGLTHVNGSREESTSDFFFFFRIFFFSHVTRRLLCRLDESRGDGSQIHTSAP